jgi:hypothetical protein
MELIKATIENFSTGEVMKMGWGKARWRQFGSENQRKTRLFRSCWKVGSCGIGAKPNRRVVN